MTVISQPGTLIVVDGTASQQIANVQRNISTGAYSPNVVIEVAGTPAASGNPLPTQDAAAGASLVTIASVLQAGSPPITPAAPSGSLTLATGGTSQLLATAGTATHGGMIYNPATAAEQGIATAESVFVSFTGTPAVASAGAQSFEILPGGDLSLPAGLTTAVNWIAATTGHKITAAVW